MNEVRSLVASLCVIGACSRAPVNPIEDGEVFEDDVESGDVTMDALDDGEVVGADGANEGSDARRLCPGGIHHERPFVVTSEVARPGAIAADFEVETLAGRFGLSSRWTGCESHIVLVHFPGITEGLWRSDATWLFSEGASNVRYLFVSDSAEPEARIEDLLRAERSVEAGLVVAVRDEGERLTWRERIHYVTGRARELEGGLGDYVRSEIALSGTSEAVVDLGERGEVGVPAPVVFGIGPDQRFDAGGNLAPAVGQAATLGMAAFLGHFYAWRVAVEEAQVAAKGDSFTVVDERTTRRIFDVPVQLPDDLMIEMFDGRDESVSRQRANVASFEVEVECEARNPFACSEWDRIATISVCADATCAARSELVRWITPYWRRGLQRYRLDFSHLVPLLRGGETHFRVELGPEWERPTPWRVKVLLRLDWAAGAVAKGALAAFGSQGFGDGYGGEGFDFTVPVEAMRVELAVLVSGHGQTAGDNCAEWCDHRHDFAVDGLAVAEIRHEGAAVGEPRGCANLARVGVMPGQWGNWAQQRAYWCPGLPVGWQVRDITALVTPGREHHLTLAGRLGEDRAPSGGDIALSAYVVWY